MNQELENLSKKDLLSLKYKIELKLKSIEIKEKDPNNKTLKDLKRGDKIFGFRLLFGPHRLEEPKGLDGKVDIMDYCDVEDITIRKDDIRIRITHPSEAFGINTTLSKDDEHCFLTMGTSKGGYDGFYTLKPENWKQDLQRVFAERLKIKERYYQEEIKILEDKLNIFMESEEKINNLFK